MDDFASKNRHQSQRASQNKRKSQADNVSRLLFKENKSPQNIANVGKSTFEFSDLPPTISTKKILLQVVKNSLAGVDIGRSFAA